MDIICIFVIGDVGDEEKCVFMLVLKGMIVVFELCFFKGYVGCDI